MMEVQQQHSPVGVGPLDFSRRGVAEASAFRVVKPKQPPTSHAHQQSHQNETNNNENHQEHTQLPIEPSGTSFVLIFRIYNETAKKSNFLFFATASRSLLHSPRVSLNTLCHQGFHYLPINPEGCKGLVASSELCQPFRSLWTNLASASIALPPALRPTKHPPDELAPHLHPSRAPAFATLCFFPAHTNLLTSSLFILCLSPDNPHFHLNKKKLNFASHRQFPQFPTFFKNPSSLEIFHAAPIKCAINPSKYHKK